MKCYVRKCEGKAYSKWDSKPICKKHRQRIERGLMTTIRGI